MKVLIFLAVAIVLLPLPSSALDSRSADASEAQESNDQAVLVYQRQLDELLAAGDFKGARSLVDTAARTITLSETKASTISSMYKKIRGKKKAVLEDYNSKIQLAVSSGDFDLVVQYVEQMTRLATENDTVAGDDREGGLASPAHAEINDPASEIRSPDRADLKGGRSSIPDGDPVTGVHARAVDREIVEQQLDPELAEAQEALVGGRLLKPPGDNALDLAAAVLRQRPDDPAALSIMKQIIQDRRSDFMRLLDTARYADAVTLIDELIRDLEKKGESLKSGSADIGWITESLDRARSLRDEGVDAAVVQITAEAEASIQKQHLTAAPSGHRPASASIGDLAIIAGDHHPDVIRLADLVIASYWPLIDQQAERNEYAKAFDYLDRLEGVARRYERPLAQVHSVRTRLTRANGAQKEYDVLLDAARTHLNDGHLVAPAGANALELAARAELLNPDRPEAGTMINDTIVRYQGHIRSLVARDDVEGRLAASTELLAAVQRWQPSRSGLIDRLTADVANLQKPKADAHTKKKTPEEVVPAQKPRLDEKQNNKSLYIFVTPF